MSGFFRVQVNIPQLTGLPEDDVVNVWHFDSDQTFAEDADDVAGRVQAFYETLDGVIYSPLMGTPARIKVYDLADPEPRVPGFESSFTFTPSSSTGRTPAEGAICLSMRGATGSGVNMRRRRGRVFLGPLRPEVFDTVNNRWQISSSTRTSVVNAALALAVGPDPGDGRLAVFSPTEAGPPPWTLGELDAAFEDVVHVWVDNAPDVVRSRGFAPTLRTSGNV